MLAEHKYGSLSEASGTVSSQQTLNMFRLPPQVAGQTARKRVIRNLLKEKNLAFFWLHPLIPCLLFIFSCHSLRSFFSLIPLVHFHGNA